jgi:hypothetical protein
MSDFDSLQRLQHLAEHGTTERIRLDALKAHAALFKAPENAASEMPEFMEVVIHKICPKCQPGIPAGARTAKRSA